mmetsp:Transcript_28251/g.44803  ORF Transcript_28251/g.44803 Transcript_28251/m.44803 type:complete len:114 (-) Transcript_28251:40-381(-)
MRPGTYVPDFDAFLCTNEVRYLVLSRSKYKAAKALDKDKEKLEQALNDIKLEALGHTSRKEARALKLRDGGDELSPRKDEDPWQTKLQIQNGYSVVTVNEKHRRVRPRIIQSL